MERQRNGHSQQVSVFDGKANDLLVEHGQEGLYQEEVKVAHAN